MKAIPVRNVSPLRKALLSWYRKEQRPLPWRQTDNPYHIWVSEVMLQQTQVKTVIPYYQRFIQRFPNIFSLAKATEQDVLKRWEGLGYYARARNLHKAAKQIVDAGCGKIPTEKRAFQKLPGVGDYIASAVLSIAFDQPHAVVDGNVKRVASRLYRIDAPVNNPSSYKIFKTYAEALLDRRCPGAFNQAIMELGAMVCRPKNPLCDTCPLKSDCRAHQAGMAHKFPLKIQTGKTPQYHIAVGVVYKKDRFLITRRKSEGLLGGLWEFPGGKVKTSESAESACIREIREEVDLVVQIDAKIARVRHAYTHFKIVMDVFACRYISGRVRRKDSVAHRWIKLGQIDQFPFPKANHKFISCLKQ